MKKSRFICNLDDIQDPGSRGFSFLIDNEERQGFVVLKDAEVYAYVNACPHTGSPLDWVEHQFLDMDETFIQCAVHDARFEMDSGLCIAGPCEGDALQKLEVIQKENAIYWVGTD